MSTSLEEYKKALSKLKIALALPKSDIIRDSVIQRFEFTIELAWKVSKKTLGLNSTAPRIIIREMAQQGVIKDTEVWFQFLEARNLTSHTYNEDLADQVYDVATKAISEFELLLKNLETLK